MLKSEKVDFLFGWFPHAGKSFEGAYHSLRPQIFFFVNKKLYYVFKKQFAIINYREKTKIGVFV